MLSLRVQTYSVPLPSTTHRFLLFGTSRSKFKSLYEQTEKKSPSRWLIAVGNNDWEYFTRTCTLFNSRNVFDGRLMAADLMAIPHGRYMQIIYRGGGGWQTVVYCGPTIRIKSLQFNDDVLFSSTPVYERPGVLI